MLLVKFIRYYFFTPSFDSLFNLSISDTAAILPSEVTLSLGRINLLDGLSAIFSRASTCLSAIPVSFVPDSHHGLV